MNTDLAATDFQLRMLARWHRLSPAIRTCAPLMIVEWVQAVDRRALWVRVAKSVRSLSGSVAAFGLACDDSAAAVHEFAEAIR